MRNRAAGAGAEVGGPAKYTATVTHYSGGEFVRLFPGAMQMPASMTFNMGEDGNALSFTHEEWVSSRG